MNLGFESDTANPNFQGAITSPDKLLHVEFYMFEPLDQHKSQMAGKRVYQTIHRVNVDEHGKERIIDTGERKRVPFVRIMKPGDNTSIIETEVRDDHKRRWPEEWLYFASNEGLIDSGDQIPGWKVEEWSHVNTDLETLRNLKYLRFHTVEQIAGASDAQCQKLGMGGTGLREVAKRALRDKISKDISKEISAKDAIIAAQEERLKRLEALVLAAPQAKQDITAIREDKPAEPVAVAKKKGGWPKGKPRKKADG